MKLEVIPTIRTLMLKDEEVPAMHWRDDPTTRVKHWPHDDWSDKMRVVAWSTSSTYHNGWSMGHEVILEQFNLWTPLQIAKPHTMVGAEDLDWTGLNTIIMTLDQQDWRHQLRRSDLLLCQIHISRGYVYISNLVSSPLDVVVEQ